MAADGLRLVDVCDVAYSLWLGQLERQYLADRTAFGVHSLLSGNTDVEPPSWDAKRAEFDRLLASDDQPKADDVLSLLGLAA